MKTFNLYLSMSLAARAASFKYWKKIGHETRLSFFGFCVEYKNQWGGL